MKVLTIFTPTYNRAYILDRCYNSLVAQTNKDFIWIIVDDGSTDNTEQLVKSWQNDKLISIEYYKQKNSGKMQAHNLGVEKTKTELFVCLDSDDYFTKETVEIIINEYKKNNKDNIVGMFAPKYYENLKQIGNKELPLNIEKSTLQEIYNKYKYQGDTMLIFKSKIIKKYSFPKIQGEKFIPETYLYDKIDQDGSLYIIRNKPMYISEYLDDGYTKNAKKNISQNPKGYMLYANQGMVLNKKIKYKYKCACRYVVGAILSGEKNFLKKSNNKILTVLAFPLGYVFYLKNYRKLRIKV